jgi:hypothetical protein
VALGDPIVPIEISSPSKEARTGPSVRANMTITSVIAILLPSSTLVSGMASAIKATVRREKSLRCLGGYEAKSGNQPLLLSNLTPAGLPTILPPPLVVGQFA